MQCENIPGLIVLIDFRKDLTRWVLLHSTLKISGFNT